MFVNAWASGSVLFEVYTDIDDMKNNLKHFYLLSILILIPKRWLIRLSNFKNVFGEKLSDPPLSWGVCIIPIGNYSRPFGR